MSANLSKRSGTDSCIVTIDSTIGIMSMCGARLAANSSAAFCAGVKS
jgi:hypothetical protein